MDTGNHPRLVVDSGGWVHIAYLEAVPTAAHDIARYSTNAGGVWIDESLVDLDSGQVAVALQDDVPVVALSRRFTGDLAGASSKVERFSNSHFPADFSLGIFGLPKPGAGSGC